MVNVFVYCSYFVDQDMTVITWSLEDNKTEKDEVELQDLNYVIDLNFFNQRDVKKLCSMVIIENMYSFILQEMDTPPPQA